MKRMNALTLILAMVVGFWMGRTTQQQETQITQRPVVVQPSDPAPEPIIIPTPFSPGPIIDPVEPGDFDVPKRSLYIDPVEPGDFNGPKRTLYIDPIEPEQC